MTIDQLVQALREEFTRQLESTGAYTKAGMQLAFEQAVSRALLRFVDRER